MVLSSWHSHSRGSFDEQRQAVSHSQNKSTGLGRESACRLLSSVPIITILYYYLSLYHNCDSTAIRLRHDNDEKLTCSIFDSRRMEAGARDTS